MAAKEKDESKKKPSATAVAVADVTEELGAVPEKTNEDWLRELIEKKTKQ